MAGDPYYDKVVLLLHCDGANNSTTFTDSSLAPKTVTAVGNAKISTAQNKFGGASGVFDGVGDYLTIPNDAGWQWGGGDWTLELFIYQAVDTALGDIIACRNAASTAPFWFLRRNAGGALRFYFLNAGSVVVTDVTTTQTVGIGSWHHVAVVRSSGVVSIFINGVKATLTGTNSATAYGAPAAALLVGSGDTSDSFNGYIDEVRITKGIARYTANFTQPAAAFPDFYGQISGIIVESLAANSFRARAYDIENGALVGEKVFTDATSFVADIKVAVKACNVTVVPVYAIWKPTTAYAIGDKVFPTNPAVTPYYYKRLVAGTSGATEPTWPTTPGDQCNDGAVNNAWEMVERLIQPVTHGPLIPS